MSQPFRPSAVQRRILASLLHLIRTEDSRLRALGATVAPVVTVSDIFTDLAGDKGRPPPTAKAIADELAAVPGVEWVKPDVRITDAVWSMMNTLPPPRVAGTPAPPPPPPPPFYAHPRLPNESAVQLLHRLLGYHPEGLTVRQMRVLSGCDLAGAASTEKTAGRVGWERTEGSGAITYKPLPQCEAVSGAFRCGLGVGHTGSHKATAFDPNTGPEPVIWDDTDPPIPVDVWDTKPAASRTEWEITSSMPMPPVETPVERCGAHGVGRGWDLLCRMPAGHAGSHFDDEKRVHWVSNEELATWPSRETADDVRLDVAPALDASPEAGPATAEGGDTSAVVEVAPPFRPLGEDREPCPPLKIYVATSLDHAHRAVAVHKALENAGHVITYRWTDHGSVQDQGIARLREVAEAELNGVRDADVLVAILPGGRGTHTEIGIATAVGMYQGHEATFVVQMFGAPSRSVVPSTARTTVIPTLEIASLVGTKEPATAEVAGVATQTPVRKTTLPHVAAPVSTFVATSSMPVAVPAETPATVFSNFIASPKSLLHTLYLFFAVFIVLALIMQTLVEWRNRHFRHLIIGTVFLLLMLGLFSFAEYKIFVTPTLPQAAAEVS